MPEWKILNNKNLVFSSQNISGQIYFPLTNTQGTIFSVITPYLSGDIKTDRFHFLTYPATIYNLSSPEYIRNIWLHFSKNNIFSLSPLFSKAETSIEAGILWYKLKRKDKKTA